MKILYLWRGRSSVNVLGHERACFRVPFAVMRRERGRAWGTSATVSEPEFLGCTCVLLASLVSELQCPVQLKNGVMIV